MTMIRYYESEVVFIPRPGIKKIEVEAALAAAVENLGELTYLQVKGPVEFEEDE